MHPGDNVRNPAPGRTAVVVAVVIALVVAATALATGGTVGTSATATPSPAASASTPAPSASAAGPRSSDSTSPTGPGSATAASRRQGIGQIRGRLTDGHPLSITVLGDDSSTGDTGWVFLWARDTLGADHTVVYHEYSRATGGYSAARTLSSKGPTVDVWNASYAGATARKDTVDLTKLYPHPTDLVILNLGHQEDPTTFDADITALWQAVSVEPAPLGLVMLQNPETATTGLQETRMKNLAATADQLGLPTVDAAKAFTDSSVPLTQLVIGARPTQQGAQLWAATVASALK